MAQPGSGVSARKKKKTKEKKKKKKKKKGEREKKDIMIGKESKWGGGPKNMF